ncbi:sigma-70 region 4 domain-containing protein [Aeromicrobium sp. Leaf350]|uniref:sigma-70 region 4 domain-containing protein n=1 Tax=Aeromicrobium sp. Leaf350 TaxID=2876565 RepID=UPI001E416486|nr:sigma-70 region 4 domain-containing protein [Aeromicrobium sp. Leaf350]
MTDELAGTPRTPASETYDEVGQRLYLLAGLLTDDDELAGRLVVRAVLAEPARSELQALSAAIYVAWMERWEPSWAVGAGAASSTGLVQQVHELPAEHRAALGLCRYGGHDYRRAAAVMGLAPERVAELLCEALRHLGTPAASGAEPSSAA